eukprot:Pgem_evm1s4365
MVTFNSIILGLVAYSGLSKTAVAANSVSCDALPSCQNWNGDCDGLNIKSPGNNNVLCKGDKNCKKKCCTNYDADCKIYTDQNSGCSPKPGLDLEKTGCIGNGTGDNSCDQICCQAPECSTCATFVDCTKLQGKNLVNRTGVEDEECGDKEDCIAACCITDARGSCADWVTDGSTCDALDMENKPDFDVIECQNKTCTKEECCKVVECDTCADWASTCAADGMQNKPNFDSITCQGDECTPKECCDPVECDTCADWDSSCATSGMQNKKDFDLISCQTDNCTAAECCDPVDCETCADWNDSCSNNNMKNKPKFDVIACKGDECDPKEC